MIELKRVIAVYFSPTHTGQKVVNAIASGFETETIVEIDLTKDTEEFHAKDGDLLIIGAPAHGGRIPTVAMERIKGIKGSGQPAVCVSMYGNRAFGNALMELNNIIETNGFVIIGATSFIGEHSFANKKRKIAEGRPNQEDLQTAKFFGAQIKEKLSGAGINDIRKLSIQSHIPGKLPTKPAGSMPKMVSKPTEDCVDCKVCIGVCPVGAITDDLSCDAERCMTCFACVKSCPHEARELKHPLVSVLAYAMSKQKDKQPQFFI
ncbi:EFR1 family ferrodoxin [Saccharicrinis sp. GN24d3]|uniref:EFR1 family ferrodoxin n=1 Tax=Saccharicrinis sp. GN24d3 TaxID=3458416 RepID=UPI004036EADB